MGVDLGDLLPRKKVGLDDLSGKTFAVDAYNTLYQFLAIIRGPTGEPLMDSQRRVTSHLTGILYRTTNLAERGIKLVYVFDGKPPTLKQAEIKRRRVAKEAAAVKYQTAIQRGEPAEARKFAQATASLKDQMVEDAHTLLTYLGVPQVQAPSEGEAQAAFMATKGDVWAAVSQDYDSLLFGARKLVRNLAITGRRKVPSKEAYVQVEPEIIELETALGSLGLTRAQLVDLGILVGTDFNPDGFKGIGPKTALKLVKEYGSLDAIGKKDPGFKTPENLDQLRNIFVKPEITTNYRLEWREPDIEGIVRFLCGDRDFNEERVRTAVERARGGLSKHAGKQTLDSFFTS
jgi:flap endonuclease-1